MVGQAQPTQLLTSPARLLKLAPILIIGLTIAAYLAVNQLATLASPTVNVYVLQPLFWLIPAAFILRVSKGNWRWSTDRGVLLAAVANALALIVIQYSAGIFAGLGWSPYSHEPISIVLNLWYVASVLVAREVIRCYLLRTLTPLGEGVSISVSWLLLSCTAVPMASFSMLQQPASAFELIGRLLLPTLAIQFLATYLAYRGGPVASIMFLTILSAVEWLAPILPNLQWMVAAFVGVFVPIVGASALQAQADSIELSESDELIGPSPGVLVASGVLVALLWFNMGVTGFLPTVVHGHSMDPTYATGDLVVTQELDADRYAVGDIVVFRDGSLSVVHRIIKIEQTDDGLRFTTQGDNNDAPDEPFMADALVGKVQVHVPKVGLPAVWYKHLMTWLLR